MTKGITVAVSFLINIFLSLFFVAWISLGFKMCLEVGVISIAISGILLIITNLALKDFRDFYNNE